MKILVKIVEVEDRCFLQGPILSGGHMVVVQTMIGCVVSSVGVEMRSKHLLVDACLMSARRVGRHQSNRK